MNDVRNCLFEHKSVWVVELFFFFKLSVNYSLLSGLKLAIRQYSSIITMYLILRVTTACRSISLSPSQNVSSSCKIRTKKNYFCKRI